MVQEESSNMHIASLSGLPEQVSEDKDKDSQTSTVESGYESQSKDQVVASSLAGRSMAPNPLPRAAVQKKDVEGLESGRVQTIISAFENPIHGNFISEVISIYMYFHLYT